MNPFKCKTLFLWLALVIAGCDSGTDVNSNESSFSSNLPVITPILPDDAAPGDGLDARNRATDSSTVAVDTSTFSPVPPSTKAYAVQGDWAVISRGAPQSDRVLVYKRNADGNWAVVTFINPTDTDTDPIQTFGASVAIDGDRLVIGASRAAGDSGPLTGAAYVYEKAATSDLWRRTAKLVASGPVSSFGGRVSLSGDTIVVSGSNDTPAVVFEFTGGVWNETAQLQPLTATGDIATIRSSSIDGDTIALTAQVDSTFVGDGVFDNAALFIYERDGLSWSLTNQINEDGTVDNNGFAGGVTVSGDSIAFQTNSGIRVLNRNGSEWNQVFVAPGDQLLGFDKDTLGVFTLEEITEPFLQFRSIHQIYRRDGNNWVEVFTSRGTNVDIPNSPFAGQQTDGQFVVFQGRSRQGLIYDFRNVSTDDGGTGDGSGDVVDDGSGDVVDDGSGDVVDDGSGDVTDGGSGGGSSGGTTSSAGSFVDVTQWNGGYIATFECTLDGDPSALQIDFNHSGSGNAESAWMLTWIGEIDNGNIAADGGFAIRRVSGGPFLRAGQDISFQVLVRNGVYNNNDFDVRCITNSVDSSGGNGGSRAANPATLVDSIEWSGGYIATFECALPNSGINDILIDFNYTGSGTTVNSWMLTWIGDIETGLIAPDGSYALRSTRLNQHLSPGQDIQFQILVRNAVLSSNHFDVDCIVN